MLKSLYISNYALIASLNIDFQRGLTVMTGETGAGKSIILGALSLILGQRADNKSIRSQEEKCIVEAVFDIAAYQHLKEFFLSNDLDYDVNHCLIRRELTANGKSRAFVNDTPVALNTLKELTSQLIDIHSQHENLLLSNAAFQLEVLDTVAQNSSLLQTYKDSFHQWKADEKALRNLRNKAEASAEAIDFIRFQFNQLEEAKLHSGELEELETSYERLNNIETIKTELSRATQLLEEEEGALSLLRETTDAIAKIVQYIPEGNDILERIKSAYVEIKDLRMELETVQEDFEYNPNLLEQIALRLNDLYTLLQKFKVQTIDELIAKRDEFDADLQEIESFDEAILQLEKQLAVSFETMQQQAKALTDSRKSQLNYIQNYMVEQLSLLGMPNIQFAVQMTESNQYGDNGKDEVEFLFSANKNQPMQAVSRIASGGEISRLMLTIKSLIAHKSDLPTIILDEIDTGISGEIADRMGEIMLEMSQAMQVISITHLPQIAAKGHTHFKVFKDETTEQTETFMQVLSPQERIDEIATMLSGKEKGSAAIENAKELLGVD